MIDLFFTVTLLFLCFSVYRFVFVVSLFLTIQSLLYAEKVEEDTKATIFISFSSQTGLFSLFLCLQFHFCCFFVSLITHIHVCVLRFRHWEMFRVYLVCIFIFCLHFLFSFSKNCFHFQNIRILKICLVWLLVFCF